jgi:hypothetical protein
MRLALPRLLSAGMKSGLSASTRSKLAIASAGRRSASCALPRL